MIPLTRLTHVHIMIWSKEEIRKHHFSDTFFSAMPARLAAVLPSLQYIFVTRAIVVTYNDGKAEHGPVAYGWRVVKCARYDVQHDGEESGNHDAAAFMLDTVKHHEVQGLLKAEELEVYDEKR